MLLKSCSLRPPAGVADSCTAVSLRAGEAAARVFGALVEFFLGNDRPSSQRAITAGPLPNRLLTEHAECERSTPGPVAQSLPGKRRAACPGREIGAWGSCPERAGAGYEMLLKILV